MEGRLNHGVRRDQRENPWIRKPRAHRGAKGFTLFELLVVILIIGTLMAVLSDRLLFYQEAAEKAAMEQTVGNLRSALHLQIADRLLKGNTNDLRALASDNPMDWLAERPANYLGERFAPKEDEVSAGSWYFDLSDRQLVYAPKRTEHLATNAAGHKAIRFKVTLVQEKNAKEQAVRAERREIQGVVLTPATPYQWF